MCRELYLFHAGEGPFPAIITIYGGMKRKQLVEDAAAIFANNGFVSLALAFFAYDGLPKVYTDEPVRIEIFENATKYLSSLDFVGNNAIGVYGISKGGDIGLAMASFLPQIQAVAWVNGSVASLGSITTYGEHTFPDLGFDASRVFYLPDGTLSFLHCPNDFDIGHPALYPFEHSLADMLFIVGLDDLCWPIEEFADFAKKKMDAVNKTNFEIVKYSGMGHLIDAPYTPPCTISSLIHLKGTFNYGGGDKRIHALQVVNVWSKVVSFFKKSLMRVYEDILQYR